LRLSDLRFHLKCNLLLLFILEYDRNRCTLHIWLVCKKLISSMFIIIGVSSEQSLTPLDDDVGVVSENLDELHFKD
jgi:hypothetical protein